MPCDRMPGHFSDIYHALHACSFQLCQQLAGLHVVRSKRARHTFLIRNGFRWRDAPPDYGPHKTIYNRFVRWSRLGVLNKIFAELAPKGGKPERIIMIDATHLKAHRTAASLLKKGLFPNVSGAPRGA